jgi:ABC-2 type transport system permease protein
MSGAGKVLEIARINLLRQLRDRSSAFFVFVLPTIIVVALGLQFGGASRARVGIVAPAGDAAADALVALLAEDQVRFDIRRPADVATLRSQVERGQLEACVVIPAGYGAAVQGQGTAEVEFLGTMDALSSGIRAPIEAAVAHQAAIITAARVAAGSGAGTWDAAQSAAQSALPSVPGIGVSVTQVGSEGLFANFGTFTFGAQTQLLLFVFLTSMTAASQLVLTKTLGVSRRMLSTPTAVGTIVLGETLGRLAVALLQAAYIVAVSSLVFGVAWGDPLAAGAIILAFSLVGAAVAMLIGAVSSNAEQASSLGVFAGLALGALGGCMIPYEIMPQVMQDVARLIPHSWAILGLRGLVQHGGGIDSVATNIAVLAGFAAVILALATWRFRRSIVR